MDPKVFVVCLLLVGCVPTPPPPPVISKEVVAKVHIQESGTDIDMWAFAMDNKLRSVPTIYNEYRLYATDGTYICVKPGQFALAKEGERWESARWHTEE